MSTASAGDLAAAVEQFRRDTGYPTEADEEQKRLREEWAEKLRPENLGAISRLDLSAVTNRGMYNSADYVVKQPQESPFIEKHDGDRYASLIRSVEHLCWGEGDVAARFDQVDDGKEGETGKSEFQKISGGFCSKLLAICHPDRFLPIAGQEQTRSCRKRALELLALPSPTGKNFWYKSVNANDTLRDHLSPHFRDDLYGMAKFLYWLMGQAQRSDDSEANTLDRSGTDTYGKPDLTAVAKRLLVSTSSLEDIVSLLEDKGQVILYGPPGTGKTYLARELAKVLAPEESRRSLVQFHPSMSYEDFFEGYRPARSGHGGIQYELTAGPLARMATLAGGASGQRHIMVIDEINRGNLPRVLGELLFLLEYRDERVRTLYRPGEWFSLPRNLWFIGTMNTADRSIALVDAALRRRFHFVPFFPNRGPIEGLLGRWLARTGEPAWVGKLVDAVNDELRGDLEGSHLLLGPSHFMKDYGSTRNEQEERLRRIWEYNIEPFIEDQFFGDPDRIQHYRFADVLARHGPAAGSEGAADADEDATPDALAGSSGDDATKDTVSEVGGP